VGIQVHVKVAGLWVGAGADLDAPR
jgi:hypothetical protein